MFLYGTKFEAVLDTVVHSGHGSFSRRVPRHLKSARETILPAADTEKGRGKLVIPADKHAFASVMTEQ